MAWDDLSSVVKSHSADFKRLWRYSVGFYGVWVAHVGRQLGLLERLAKSPESEDDLIAATDFHPPAVHAWCSAAASYGFVSKKKGGKLHLSKRMKAILVDRRSPDYLGGQFSYLALRSLEYSGFEDLFRSGRARNMAFTFEAIEQATDWDHYAFLAAVRRNKKLHSLLSRGCRLLDVGCGTGSLLAKLHDTYPRSSLVGIDPSEEAMRRAKKMLENRPVQIMKMEGQAMRFEGEFDIACFGESLCPAKDKQKVMSNCYRVLKRGGTIAIVEGLMPPKRDDDEHRLIMGMQLDFALQGHKFMTRSEVAGLLKDAGFSKPRFADLGGSVYLVTAIK